MALADVVVAATAVGTIIFGIAAIKSSGAMADSATKQAAASHRAAESARAQNLAGVRLLRVEVPKGLLRAAQIDHEGRGKILWGVVGRFIWAWIGDQRQRSFVTGYPDLSAFRITKTPEAVCVQASAARSASRQIRSTSARRAV